MTGSATSPATLRVCSDTLLFSAKESVYKAWFPLAHRSLGFSDADITINAVNGTFVGRLLVAAPALSGLPPGRFSLPLRLARRSS